MDIICSAAGKKKNINCLRRYINTHESDTNDTYNIFEPFMSIHGYYM